MNPKIVKEVGGHYLMSSGAVLLFAIESSDGGDRPESGKARAREVAEQASSSGWHGRMVIFARKMCCSHSLIAMDGPSA
ncbi:hypothetical protein [Paraburkholderia sp. CI3]|uniref:hypothetical protein n=1 Tax=Paraburkholderia sp. CI3 TaxID=2991060 RepID=UPI003D195E7B